MPTFFAFFMASVMIGESGLGRPYFCCKESNIKEKKKRRGIDSADVAIKKKDGIAPIKKRL